MTTLDHAIKLPADLQRAAEALADQPLSEDLVRTHLDPLFSRVLTRDEIYLANHSLGRPLDRMAGDVQRALDAWYIDMDGAWDFWMDRINRFRALVASMIGVSRADAVVPKANAGQGIRAVLNALPNQPPRIVTTRGEFDSGDFILKAYARQDRAHITWIDPDDDGLFHADRIAAAITPETDLVMISHVFFRTGQVLEDLERVVEVAHARDAIVLLDTYHSAGVLPLALEALDIDFAVGGSYKYTRGGPGACWLMIHPRHLDSARLRPIDTGWFAKKDTFSYIRTDTPEYAEGGDAWLESTPAVLPAVQAIAGLEFTLAVGIERLRAYSLVQQRSLIARLTGREIPVREIEPRGGFILLPHDDAPSLAERMRTKGVNSDVRAGSVRLCPDVLNTEAEFDRASEIIASVW